MSGTRRTDPVAAVPEKLDQWHDFRKSVALVSMVLFFFCLVAVGWVVYQLAIVGDERGVFDPWSFLRFMSVAVPLGVAAVTGVGVYRATDNAQSKRRGRIMGIALLVATVLLVTRGMIGDHLS